MRLPECRAVLTGASGGIGLALAEKLCAGGAQLIAVVMPRFDFHQRVSERHLQTVVISGVEADNAGHVGQIIEQAHAARDDDRHAARQGFQRRIGHAFDARCADE